MLSKTKERKRFKSMRRRRPRNWCLVYSLREECETLPRYIGQTRLPPSDRFKFHMKALWRQERKSPCQKWLARLETEGRQPVIEIIDENGIWDISEAVWIDRYRTKGAQLLNVLSVVP